MKNSKISSHLLISIVILSIFCSLIGLLQFGIIPQHSINFDYQNSYLAPSQKHWLGTDIFGRDVFFQATRALKTAFLIGLFTSTLAILLGTFFGMTSAFFGGTWDRIVRYLYTSLDCIPYILLLATFSYALGPGLINIFLALGLTGWTKTCRLIRIEVSSLKESSFLSSANAIGAGYIRQFLFHIFPHLKPILTVQFGLLFIQAIKLEVILSFIGLGLEPDTPSWGTMINDARQELIQGIWWNLFAALLFMSTLVLSIMYFLKSYEKSTSFQRLP